MHFPTKGFCMWDDLGFDAPLVAQGSAPPNNHDQPGTQVSEVIIQASRGGGTEVIIGLSYYQERTHNPFATAELLHTYADATSTEAEAYADAHISGDPNSPAYQQAREAIISLYARAKVGTLGGSQGDSISGPNGTTLTSAELLAGLNNIQIVVGPFAAPPGTPAGTVYNSYTDVTTPTSIIHIDPARLTDRTDMFGQTIGLNYAVYHEMAHALPDGRTTAAVNDPNREKITNEYGQMLSELTQALYPSDLQLGEVGGTVTR
jgi:hypothetical protein